MTTKPQAKSQPTNFDLFDKHVHVQYAATSLTGKPLLTYTENGQSKHFTAAEIRTEETSLGQLVSVTLEAVPDLHTITFSFFLPQLQIEREAHVTTEGIYTTARTSIGGPALVKGQISTWRSISLSGIARVVQS